MTKNFIKIDGVQREYQVERKHTKTIKYKVYPDLSIKVIVPESISKSELQNRLLKRANWIKKSLKFYSRNHDKKKSEFNSGSTIYYLGKQYRLKIIDSSEKVIKLIGKFLVVNVKNKDIERIEILIDEWYRSHAILYFNKVVCKSLAKLSKYGIKQPTIFIRKMKTRWGSCTQKKNKIIINSNLIKESSQCIEYVIMHELCHLKYQNHDNKFYTFISIVMPDWRVRKKKLEKLKL